jgi:hypothetical protein
LCAHWLNDINKSMKVERNKRGGSRSAQCNDPGVAEARIHAEHARCGSTSGQVKESRTALGLCFCQVRVIIGKPTVIFTVDDGNTVSRKGFRSALATGGASLSGCKLRRGRGHWHHTREVSPRGHLRAAPSRRTVCNATKNPCRANVPAWSSALASMRHRCWCTVLRTE